MAPVYYISHPQVIIDPNVPVPQWHLSAVGLSRCDAIKDRPWVQAITIFVSSAETKALETMDALRSRRDDRQRIIREDAHENDRSATGFIPPERFDAYVERFFGQPDQSLEGWETACDAQTRIVAVVDEVLSTLKPSEPMAFVGHGGVGTLLLCHLMGQPIARLRDQPPGGGNVFAFDSESRALHHGWKAMEEMA